MIYLFKKVFITFIILENPWKKLNKKAKMLNFEKSISSTKEYFFKPKDGIKMSFMIDLVKKNRYESVKPL